MSIPGIAAVKVKLRDISLADAKAVAQQALGCQNAADVRNLTFP